MKTWLNVWLGGAELTTSKLALIYYTIFQERGFLPSKCAGDLPATGKRGQEERVPKQAPWRARQNRLELALLPAWKD
jgi:hypothetical protein